MHIRNFVSIALVAAGLAAQSDPDWSTLLRQPRYSLVEAVAKGVARAGTGVPFKVELEIDKGKLVYSIDVAQGAKTCCVVLDVKEGGVLENDVDDEDRRAIAAGCKVGLVAAIESALRRVPGRALAAEVTLRDGKSAVAVTVFDGKVTTVVVDGVTGEVVQPMPAPAAKPVADPAFTDTFVLDADELTATGVNPFFPLTPGHTLELEGRDGDGLVQLTITVLAETRKVAGVETRVIEERESKSGKVVEVSRNYFAISKKTNSVYYFGEDVDMYTDGKVTSHDGAWLAGEKGARFGLMIPGTFLLGSRYYQEVAPGVAMDRAEVVDVNGALDTPAGRFTGVLVTEETTPMEKGKGRKYYARGIGLISDSELRLVKVPK